MELIEIYTVFVPIKGVAFDEIASMAVKNQNLSSQIKFFHWLTKQCHYLPVSEIHFFHTNVGILCVFQFRSNDKGQKKKAYSSFFVILPLHTILDISKNNLKRLNKLAVIIIETAANINLLNFQVFSRRLRRRRSFKFLKEKKNDYLFKPEKKTILQHNNGREIF